MPNPLKEQTLISYQLPTATTVQLVVYDLQGKPIQTLLNQVYQDGGPQQVTFWAKDLAKGIYLVNLRTKNRVETKRMVVLD